MRLTDERFALAAQHRARHLRRPPAPRTPIPGCTAPGAASAARRVTVRGCIAPELITVGARIYGTRKLTVALSRAPWVRNYARELFVLIFYEEKRK